MANDKPKRKKLSAVEPWKLHVQQVNGHPLHFVVESVGEPVLEGETWLNHAHNVQLDKIPMTHIGDAICHGECSCADFEFRRKPKHVDKGEIMPCNHIVAAMIYRMQRWSAKYVNKNK